MKLRVGWWSLQAHNQSANSECKTGRDGLEPGNDRSYSAQFFLMKRLNGVRLTQPICGSRMNRLTRLSVSAEDKCPAGRLNAILGLRLLRLNSVLGVSHVRHISIHHYLSLLRGQADH